MTRLLSALKEKSHSVLPGDMDAYQMKDGLMGDIYDDCERVEESYNSISSPDAMKQ